MNLNLNLMTPLFNLSDQWRKKRRGPGPPTPTTEHYRGGPEYVWVPPKFVKTPTVIRTISNPYFSCIWKIQGRGATDPNQN